LAYSRVTKIGDGSSTQFAVNFALGYLDPSTTTARVGTESDGAGNPVYRNITYISESLFQISGTAPGIGVPILFERTVPKDTLLVNFSDGDVMTEENLDIAQKQAMMAVHEVLDGRLGTLTADLDAGGNRIKNLGAPIQGTDAANKDYVTQAVADVEEEFADAIEEAQTILDTAIATLNDALGSTKVFSGDGTTVVFDMENDINDIRETQIYVNGVYRHKSKYSVSDGVLTFAEAPITGFQNIEVLVGARTALAVAVPSDDSVTYNKLDPAIRRKLQAVITPYDFGGVGDGEADDTAAVQACFDAVRGQLIAVAVDYPQMFGGSNNVDFNGIWRITDTINCTGLTSWSTRFTGGMFILECEDKIGFDLTGSRGYMFDGTHWYGDRNAMPKAAWMAARSDENGYCDNVKWHKCSTTGNFSEAAYIRYAQEAYHEDACIWMNFNPHARVAIMVGTDTDFSFSSDFQTIKTGAESFIDHKFTEVTWSLFPLGYAGAIYGITKAANAVVTVNTGHPFNVGDKVCFFLPGGMTQIWNKTATVLSKTATTVTIDLNTTSFSNYTSDGTIFIAADYAAVHIGRASQMTFDTCYFVNCGSPHIQFDFPDASYVEMHNISIDALFEGCGQNMNVFFTPRSAAGAHIKGFSYSTYVSRAAICDLFVDETTGGVVTFYTDKFSSVQSYYQAQLLASSGGNSRSYGGNIMVDVYDQAGNCRGAQITVLSENITYDKSKLISDYRDGDYAATFGSSSGTPPTVAIVRVYTAYVGQYLYVSIHATITNNNTGAGYLTMSLPGTAILSGALSGMNLSTGVTITGVVTASGGQLRINSAAGAYPVATGNTIVLSGFLAVNA
jgi:hypothetical protein